MCKFSVVELLLKPCITPKLMKPALRQLLMFGVEDRIFCSFVPLCCCCRLEAGLLTTNFQPTINRQYSVSTTATGWDSALNFKITVQEC